MARGARLCTVLACAALRFPTPAHQPALLFTNPLHSDRRDFPRLTAGSLPPCPVLDERWFVGTLSRLHLNSFRADIPRPLASGDWASFSAYISRGSGTAVYELASLYNHDCDPNVDAAWPDGDATMTLSARRDIAAGAARPLRRTTASPLCSRLQQDSSCAASC